MEQMLRACELGDLRTVRTLLKYVNTTNSDEYGNTPLHIASMHGQADTVAFLLRNGFKNTPNSRSLMPLHYASKYGHLEVVRILLKTDCDVNAKDDYNRTALHLACEMNHHEIVKCLLLSPKIAPQSKDIFGHVPAYYANEKVASLFPLRKKE